VANRWDFLISLLVAVIFTVTYEKLFELTKLELILAAAAVAVYGILTFAFPSVKSVKYEFFLLLFTLVFILILQSKWFDSRKTAREAALFVLIFLTLGFHGYAFYSPHFYGYVDEFLTKAKVDKLSGKGDLRLIPEIKDKTFYRIETYGESNMNEALTAGFHDVSGYFSLMDGDITSYFKNLELLSQRTAYRFENLDNRTILDTLAGVKYFISTDKTAAPYGFQLLKELKGKKDTYYLFENRNALPLGYTYQNYMLKSDYDKLSALEKQNAMMNAVILNDDNNYANKTNRNMESGLEKLKANITTSNVEISNNRIEVKKAGGTITLDFAPKPNTETYVRFGNLNTSKKSKTMTTLEVKADNGAAKEANVKSMYYNSYFGKVNYLINTGYSENGQTRVTITFPDTETFSYDSLDVYSQDMGSYQSQVTALEQSTLQNIKRKNNSVRGDITLDQKGIMALSIPYSKGWSAYVDGKKTELLHANVMYMALPLDAGNHHIVLKYQTPLLKVGIFISAAAFLLFGAIYFIRRKSKNKINSDSSDNL
jgi:uncharacterized membrane protein YfhO